MIGLYSDVSASVSATAVNGFIRALGVAEVETLMTSWNLMDFYHINPVVL